MYCPACGANLPPQSTFCFQCGGKLPEAKASTGEGDPKPAPPPPPIASQSPPQAPAASAESAPAGGGRSKLGEDVGALGCSVLLFFAGGGLAVMEGKWGKWALVVGGLVAIVGMITGNVTFWAILKRLWSKK